MTINVCEDCGFEVRCGGCHKDCPQCGGDMKRIDYVRHRLAKKDNDDNKH